MNALLPAADILVAAYRQHRPQPVSAAAPDDRRTAYLVQQQVWRALAGSDRPTAWKVGAPDREAEPTAAPVFPHLVAATPATLPTGSFIGFGIEAEIAVRFGRALPARAAPYARADILDAIAAVHVAIELVDSRLADPAAAGPLWSLADNLSNNGLVLGDAIAHWREADFAEPVVRIRANGTMLLEQPGRQPLDDLFYCLPWWINHVGGARAGDIVTTGAWTGMHPVGLPAAVEVEFAGLGRAQVRVD